MHSRALTVDRCQASRPAHPSGGLAGGKMRRAAALGAFFLSGLAWQPAVAQEMDNLFANPPSLPEVAPSAPEEAATAPEGRHAMLAPGLASTLQPHAGRERAFDLKIELKDGVLYDPSQGRYQKVSLRGYKGTGVKSQAFVAPQIEVTPGDTVRITLHNNLKGNEGCTGHGAPDEPHCFNGTNLHSHGLWVSPTGNSDNVLLSLNPGTSFQYEYNIPADHPAGTFWYHPHRHGSTALQVASGMAGALIVHGDRKPTRAVNGDLDTLLRDHEGRPFKDRTLLFQQIQYYCLDGTQQTWDCKPDQTGIIDSYDNLGPETWQQSGRWTSINGKVMPTFADARTGKVERWRLIHAGIRETITVQFRKMAGTATSDERPTKAAMARFLDNICTGPVVPYQVVAADGLTMDTTFTTQTVTLQPGYRYDLLVVFPEPGNYCVTEVARPGAATVSRSAMPRGMLGVVSVHGNAPKADPTQTLVHTLVDAAKHNMPVGVREAVIRDLTAKDGSGNPAIRLSRFVPHRTITEQEIGDTPQQEMVFYLGTGIDPQPDAFKFTVGNSFEVVQGSTGKWVPKGASSYDPARIDRPLILGKAQQWEFRSYSVSHPFHIHVNPFQIVAILDPQGRDVSVPGYVEADGDNQFAGLKGVWKDTLWVKTNLSPKDDLTNPPQKKYYRLIVRTRYERYIGEFVLHCHILDHEDQGMMQNVAIGLSDGAGGLAHAHQ
ncbi:multicopper oxidase domain-containing protein [Ralstonia solanacearum]|uniref:multicopper oxidase family protein n=1 Tax=Ralstonia solanacearum TaxID=305 RepID=UPI00114358E3|nr:multicopper oxidase domain-containing protein [Ralstonia solanacearum]